MLKVFIKKDDFLISNFETSKENFLDWKLYSHINRIFGYCFCKNKYIRNTSISLENFQYIRKNNIDISGIFLALNFNKGKVNMVIDPLFQFNLFLYRKNDKFSISSSIEMLRLFHGLKEVDEEYLFDQLAYQSPMRSKTILKNVSFLQFDDLYCKSSSDIVSFLDENGVKINTPNYQKYKNYSYNSLLRIYLDKLNNRAAILSSTFDEIHLQLTGGADSRLALSSLLKFKNVRCYVYGDGNSQNRLIFEEILSMTNKLAVNSIKTIGAPISNSSRIIRSLYDMNYFKLNNVNTYMNGAINSNITLCKVTGYYGANISGGVGLPPEDTRSNKRLSKIPSELFTYHEYVNRFKEKNSSLRKASLGDQFYINNRGKSHYAAHSLADNKNINSADILYDFINLLLVEKCPYTDNDINRCAITVDLIYLNSPKLALFPYDDRKIPMYRAFKNVPNINCFEGFNFPPKLLNEMEKEYPILDDRETDLLGSKKLTENILSIFQNEKVQKASYNYPELEYLTKQDDIQANIFLCFLLGKMKISSVI